MKVAVTTLAVCVTSLLALGLVMLYSASMTQVGGRYLMMQFIWCLLGLVSCATVASMDYQQLKRKEFIWAFFAVTFVLLVLVLLPLPGGFTRAINGAHRWFILPGGVRIQPSELGKLAIIFAIAWYGDRYRKHAKTWGKGLMAPLCIAGVMLAVIFVEPDRGTTILMCAVVLGMLIMAGADWKKMLVPIPAAVAVLVYLIWNDPMRMRRIFSWLDLEATKAGVGLQQYQAKIALGSGGLTGLGLGNGRQKLGFLPEHHTDFIFSIIGEELGLIATLLIVITFLIIAFCGFRIALQARDAFGALLATGITLLISFQAVINIGVVTGALPNKGLPLPFISYGGSNLVAMLTCVGLLFSVARQAGNSIQAVDDFVTKPSGNPFSAKPT